MTLLVLAVVGITAGGVALAGSGRRRRRRLATRAARDLPGAVGDLARSVGAGATLTVALRELAGGPVGLLGTEVAGAVALLDRGLGVDRVMELWGRASRIDGVELLVAACRFSRGRGVALVAALDGVAAALVDRIELDDEVRALTSQARTSATVLVALPLIGVTVLAAVDPSFVGVVLGSTSGRACLVIGVVLDGLGAAVSNRLVTRAVAASGVQGSGRRHHRWAR